MGTLSTKTTHPVYLRGLQEIWDAVGLPVELKSPLDYDHKTKGEIVAGCADIDLLKRLAGHSTSCGRFGVFKKTHCGRCVPCLVRRASFLRAQMEDPTIKSKISNLTYHYPSLKAAAAEETATDIRSVANAVVRVDRKGIDHFLGGSLSFSEPEARVVYRDVISRGLNELGDLLKAHGVI